MDDPRVEIARQAQALYEEQMKNKEPEDFHARVYKPYSYREFPKLMYHPEGGKPCVAETKEHEELLVKKGWSARPFAGHVVGTDGVITPPPADKPEAQRKAK